MRVKEDDKGGKNGISIFKDMIVLVDHIYRTKRKGTRASLYLKPDGVRIFTPTYVSTSVVNLELI